VLQAYKKIDIFWSRTVKWSDGDNFLRWLYPDNSLPTS